MLFSILFILALPLIIVLSLTAFIFFRYGINDVYGSWWRWQMLIAFDQLVNTFFKGWADETLSSRMYRKSLKIPCKNCKWAKNLIDKIFFFNPNHCKESYYSEKNRIQLPPALRGEE